MMAIFHDDARPTGHPTWFDHMSPDVKTSAAFYEKIFGWTYEVQGPEFGHYHMAHVGGRAAAGLGQPGEQGGGGPPAWMVYYSAEDVAAMTAKAKELGATIMMDCMEVPETGKMSIVQDPTGAVFGLWEPINHKGAGISGAHGAMTWCEVNTGDAEAAKAFYTGLFDATAEPMPGDDMTYYMIKVGETTVGGILQMDEKWEGIPPHWSAYFQVDNTEEAAKAAEAAGGKINVPVFDTPFGKIAVLSDPAGAVFSVVQPPSA